MIYGYYQPYWIDTDELEHHGIKGQKWGVRRFQNEDGTLTNAGKQRYSNSSQNNQSIAKTISTNQKKYSNAQTLYQKAVFAEKYKNSKSTSNGLLYDTFSYPVPNSTKWNRIVYPYGSSELKTLLRNSVNQPGSLKKISTDQYRLTLANSKTGAIESYSIDCSGQNSPPIEKTVETIMRYYAEENDEALLSAKVDYLKVDLGKDAIKSIWDRNSSMPVKQAYKLPFSKKIENSVKNVANSIKKIGVRIGSLFKK